MAAAAAAAAAAAEDDAAVAAAVAVAVVDDDGGGALDKGTAAAPEVPAAPGRVAVAVLGLLGPVGG
jgi:hypothetical protein